MYDKVKDGTIIPSIIFYFCLFYSYRIRLLLEIVRNECVVIRNHPCMSTYLFEMGFLVQVWYVLC